jgi:hypothetical protein
MRQPTEAELRQGTAPDTIYAGNFNADSLQVQQTVQRAFNLRLRSKRRADAIRHIAITGARLIAELIALGILLSLPAAAARSDVGRRFGKGRSYLLVRLAHPPASAGGHRVGGDCLARNPEPFVSGPSAEALSALCAGTRPSPYAYRAGMTQASTTSATSSLPWVSGLMDSAANRLMSPPIVPTAIGIAKPICQLIAKYVTTGPAKPPQIAPW